MDLSNKIAAMKKNALHTTGGGSDGGTGCREGIIPGTHDLPL